MEETPSMLLSVLYLMEVDSWLSIHKKTDKRKQSIGGHSYESILVLSFDFHK